MQIFSFKLIKKIYKNSKILFRWTPYSFVLMYNSFKNSTEQMPELSTISAVFAKSSVVWSTLIYIVTNRSIKSKLIPKRNRLDMISKQETLPAEKFISYVHNINR